MKHIFLISALTFSGFDFGECSDADKKALETFDRVGAMREKAATAMR